MTWAWAMPSGVRAMGPAAWRFLRASTVSNTTGPNIGID
jgi:hypothetical protein